MWRILGTQVPTPPTWPGGLNAPPAGQPVKRALPLAGTGRNRAMLRQPFPDGLEAAIEHRAPEVPFWWKGVQHDPADIRRFNGKALAYIPVPTASGDIQLHILDDVQLVRGWLETRCVNRLITSFAEGAFAPSLNLTGIMAAPPALPRGLSPYLDVGEHEMMMILGEEGDVSPWWGNVLTLAPGLGFSDLTDVWMSWPWTNWNDQISSISSCGSYCVLWDHINYQGNQLWAGAFIGGQPLYYLSQIGWNDRISSFMNFGP